jgi:septum formation protein
VAVSGVEELVSGPPEEVVVENAYRKAAAVAARIAEGEQAAVGRMAAAVAGRFGDALVLGVDTVVVLGSTIYGKPSDVADARQTLTALSGRRHLVLSGVCLLQGGRQRSAVARTAVEFRTVDQRLMDWYLSCGEWRDRAGGYAIQGRGAALVAGVEGDYLNVVGLPVATLLEIEPGLLQPDPRCLD